MNKYLRICLLFLASWVLAAGVYVMLSHIKSNRVELIFSVKSIEPTACSLVFGGQREGKEFSDTVRQDLQAIQFFMPLKFRYNTEGDIQQVGLLLTQGANTLYVESLTIVQYQFSLPDTVYSWQCRDSLQQLVLGEKGGRIVDHTAQYLELATGDAASIFYLRLAESLMSSQGGGVFQFGIGKWLLAWLIGGFLLLAFSSPENIFRSCDVQGGWKGGSWLVKAFLATLFVVLLNSVFRLIPDMENRENRALSQAPALHCGNVYSYTDELSAYLSDQFAFRNFFFFCNSWLHSIVLHESAKPDKVIQGNHGWFYYQDDGSIADYRRMSKIDSNLVNYVHQNFSARIEWLKRRGIRFYMLVPPNKERIYPDYMPSRYVTIDGLGHNSLDFFKKMLDNLGKVHILDPTDSLLAARRRRDVYYQTDTHWNTYGGFKGYQVLMNAIAKDFPSIKPFRDEDFYFSEMYNSEGDLAAMLGLSAVRKRKEYNMVFKDTSRKLDYNFPSTMVLRMKQSIPGDTSRLKLLMFRDSYGSYLIPFLNQHFSETVYAWNYIFMDRLIEEEKPDIVVFETLQRFLLYSILMGNPSAVNQSVTPANSF